MIDDTRLVFGLMMWVEVVQGDASGATLGWNSCSIMAEAVAS